MAETPTITVEERHKSRRRSRRQAERTYLIRGTDDDVAARQALLDHAPEELDSLDTRESEVEELEDGLWLGTITWSPSSHDDPLKPNQVLVRFSSKGGTQHLTQSFETLRSYPSASRVYSSIGRMPRAMSWRPAPS